MTALESLARLHRWQLDERRRQLADLDQLALKLREEDSRLAAEQTNEQATAAASSEAATAYANYARRLIERQKKLAASLTSVEQQIAAAREALAEAYQEVKRYEIAAANRVMQQRRRVGRQQQRVLDELGLEGYRRRGRS